MNQGSAGPEWSENKYSNASNGTASGLGGSVRRARERVEAGLPAEQSQRIRDLAVGGPAALTTKTPRLRLNPDDHPTYSSQGHSQRQFLSGGPKARLVLPPSGTPTSNITSPSKSQWPLREEDESTEHLSNPSTADRVHGKGPPPQRPPRPSYVPSILDTAKNQGNMPLYHHRQPQQSEKSQAPMPQSSHFWESKYGLSPGVESGPLGTAGVGISGGSSSRPSTLSSVGSIPEFPTPGIPMPPPLQTRRSANLGPPPSSRRGASSYYSQSSYVTPIPEELPEPTQNLHGSYASSHVMPSSWGDGSPEYYVGEEEEDLNEGEDGRESRGGDHDESTGLVRKASLGKRHKPSLTTIRSSEGLANDRATRSEDNSNNQTIKDSSIKPSLISRSAVPPTEDTGEAFAMGSDSSENDQHSTDGRGLDGGTGLSNASSSFNEESEKAANAMETNVPFGTEEARSKSPVTHAIDERVKQIMGGLERGGALQSGTPSPATITPPRSKSMKRPPRLDIDAVKEAEARGSLTSLPDLIRRATRLASNLDRGKTASRLGMRDMLSGGEMTEKDLSYGRARSSSLTDMLASFPPPGLSTPTPTGDRSSPRWPSPFAKSNLAYGQPRSLTEDASDFTKSKRSRKCCGMPLWAFTLLLVVLVLLVAAAVIIPVALIVLPRQHTASANAVAATDLSNCQKSTPCGNGGTSIVTANACSCICVNGFTGATCNQQSDSGCTTVNLSSNTQSQAHLNNVTLGSSIPRLISAAQSNFSIPLNSSAILSMFSAANLSCTSENALVTFNSESQRRDLSFQKLDLMPVFSLPSIATPSLIPRQDASLSATFSINENSYPSSEAGVYTSNGIILAGGTTSTLSFTTPTPLATATATSSTSIFPTSQTVSPKDFDFARVVVLYIFQETRLDNAVTAQGKLQSLFDGGGFNRSDIAVGDGVIVNFGTGTVNLGNGTVVGGKDS